jgi:dipeptidyl-peptidase-3
MSRYLIALLAGIAALGTGGAAQTPPRAQGAKTPLVERVADTGFIQLESPSFAGLDARQKAMAYWLTQAAIAIDPIIYDQLSQYGLRQKRILEGIMARHDGARPATFGKIREYALLFWANRGNHNDTTGQKFLPGFTFEELRDAALQAHAAGAFRTAAGDVPPLTTADAVTKELTELRPSFFDPAFEPMLTAKTPPPGLDILQASSNTFYQGVSLADLKTFQERYPLNSRVVKDARGIREVVYRAGTPDGKVPPGLYATYLGKTIGFLERARGYADPAQATAISSLIRFYQTGEPADWLQFGADWMRNDATVDFANGFIEVYRDARGAKGSSQSFVTVTDRPVTKVMTSLATNAAYFEERAPWTSVARPGVAAPASRVGRARCHGEELLVGIEPLGDPDRALLVLAHAVQHDQRRARGLASRRDGQRSSGHAGIIATIR